MHLNGWDLRPCKLIDRKQALSGLADWQGTLRYSDHLAGDPAAMRRQACAMGLEGIICKQADAPYRGGRGNAWLKVKCHGREEFIVLGWTPPGGARPGLGSLHVGYYDQDGRLHYAGGVGTGFSEQELEYLRAKLEPLAAEPPPGLLVSGDPLSNDINWVRPELVAEVQYGTWSGEGRLRHPVYLGLREDKPAEEVVRDVPDPEAKRTALRPRRAAQTTVSKAPRRKARCRRRRPPCCRVIQRLPVAASWWRGRRSAG